MKEKKYINDYEECLMLWHEYNHKSILFLVLHDYNHIHIDTIDYL